VNAIGRILAGSGRHGDDAVLALGILALQLHRGRWGWLGLTLGLLIITAWKDSLGSGNRDKYLALQSHPPGTEASLCAV
jgi:hypothetical protein